VNDRPLDEHDVCLLGFEIPDDAILAAARAASAAGARVILNPAPARDLPEELLDLGVMLTPNGVEVTALTMERDPERAGRALAAESNAPVIVTLGERGALLIHPEGIALLPAPRVDVVDTTGAGDVLSGVLAAGLAAGLDVEEAARRAVEAASASVRVAGARG